MPSRGSPALADSTGESPDSESPVVHRTLPAHVWKRPGMTRYVTASTRALLAMADFNQPCRPPKGRVYVLHATTQSGFPSDEEAETPPPSVGQDSPALASS